MKIWLIIGASLILVGGIVFVGVMSALNWDFKELSTHSYEERCYEITETFGSISIQTDTADLELVPSEDGSCSVRCYEQKNVTHRVTVTEGSLTISLEDTRKWYEHIGIGTESSRITVSIPKGAYDSLSVQTSTGDVSVSEDFQFNNIDVSGSTADIRNRASVTGSLNIKTTTGSITVSDVSCGGDLSIFVSTGKAELTNVTCQNLTSEGDTGDLTLKNVIASEAFSIKRDTGDVSFEHCDAARILVSTDTGDVQGSLCSDKVFLVETKTGDKEIPRTVSGGSCQITTDTGDVRITIG